MRKLASLLFVLALHGTFAQIINRPIFFEVNSIPNDSLHTVYISYKIPYNRLVFVKENAHYRAGVRVGIEINSDDTLIVRDFSDRSVNTVDYDATNSTTEFLQGLFEFKLTSGNYSFSPSIRIDNMGRTFNLPSQFFEIGETNILYVLKPIVVEEKQNSCNGNTNLALMNYGNLPFQAKDVKIVIPVSTSISGPITAKIIQSDSLLTEKKLTRSIGHYSGVQYCENSIMISMDQNSNYELWILNDFSGSLDEGKFDVQIVWEDSTEEITMDVEWIDKPRSLVNPELAIELIEFIDDRETVNILLDYNESDYDKALKEYWAKYDRDKTTKFNEVMYEFYRRVDYADENYSTVSTPRGVKTDRGKVYLKFGEPDKIEREYSAGNEILEIWTYEKISKEFVFSDKTGLGNFLLVK